MNDQVDDLSQLPSHWRRELQGLLEPGEALVGWLEFDLAFGRLPGIPTSLSPPSASQRTGLIFVTGLLVLTDRRLLARQEGRENLVEYSGDGTCVRAPKDGALRSPGWQSWQLEPDCTLRCQEHGGVGTLEFLSPTDRLGCWHYTAPRHAAASKLIQKHLRLLAGPSATQDGVLCPLCGAVLLDSEGPCPTCAEGPTQPKISALFRLLDFSRARKGLIFLGFALTLASTATGLVPPYLTMPLLDQVLIPHQAGKPAPFGLVFWYLLGLIGAAIISWVLDWGRLYTLAWLSERISADLRGQTYAHLQRLSVEFFGGKRTGDLMSRISRDTDRLCNFLSLNLVDFANDILMIVLTSLILLSIDVSLALVVLCPFPLIVWMVRWVRRRLLRSYQQANIAWAGMTSVLADTIPGIRVVKAFAQEQREIDRFDHANEYVFEINNRLNRIWSLFGPTVTFLTTAGLVVVWAYASWEIYNHLITVGVLTAFLAYISRFYSRIESMIRMTSAIQRATASAQRIFEILDRRPTVPDPVHPIQPTRMHGQITLRDVHFKYGNREVVHGLDLIIEAGEMIGLVGPSGAGKSTLLNLICRFYDVSSGAILVDRTDIRSFPVEAYRRHIGIVLQDPFLFYGTVAENIAYGRPHATRAEVVAAARAARAHEFILRLPEGYDSVVGERGQSLSGGERQRISIARALLVDPRILLLDEATSSVDTETEREIQSALENLIAGRTTVAIAHRLSTLRRANRLVVIEQGRIVEVGRHEELLEQNGVYTRLHRAQMEALEGHVV